jgi:hypothetical protein
VPVDLDHLAEHPQGAAIDLERRPVGGDGAVGVAELAHPRVAQVGEQRHALLAGAGLVAVRHQLQGGHHVGPLARLDAELIDVLQRLLRGRILAQPAQRRRERAGGSASSPRASSVSRCEMAMRSCPIGREVVLDLEHVVEPQPQAVLLEQRLERRHDLGAIVGRSAHQALQRRPRPHVLGAQLEDVAIGAHRLVRLAHRHLEQIAEAVQVLRGLRVVLRPRRLARLQHRRPPRRQRLLRASARARAPPGQHVRSPPFAGRPLVGARRRRSRFRDAGLR